MADDEKDGKPKTKVSNKDIAGRVTFVEIIFNFLCAFSGEDNGVMGRGRKRIMMM